MKVLVIDNGTNYKKKLAKLLEAYDTYWIDHSEVKLALLERGYDFIVLTGADGGHSVKYYASKLYKKEQILIQAANIPVIGICFGAQLIAYTYNARLSFVFEQVRVKGLKRIWNIKQTPFDFKYYGGRVWSSQKWRITELPDELEAWCASCEGIEVFKHKDKQIYGIQFHPERRAEDNDGYKIFDAILNHAKNSKITT
jgi:GMP synthase-like glutamine amidotransferase